MQGKASIVVPNPLLTGGHQVKNTKYLLQQDAIWSVSEAELKKQPELLAEKVEALLQDSGKRKELANTLQALTIPDATQRLAKLLLEVANQ